MKYLKRRVFDRRSKVLRGQPPFADVFFADVLNEEEFVLNEEEFAFFLQKFHEIAVTVPNDVHLTYPNLIGDCHSNFVKLLQESANSSSFSTNSPSLSTSAEKTSVNQRAPVQSIS